MEFPKGRRFDGVTFLGAIPGTTDKGASALVNVLSAVYPTSRGKQTNSEHLPVLVVVPVETRYPKGSWVELRPLFVLASMMDDGCDLDLGRTVVVMMHGSVEISKNDQIMAGSPSLPSLDSKQWISLDAPSVARLLRWTRAPDGQPPIAVVNVGCFSSTRRGKSGTTFNEELAVLLAKDGITVYGPPFGGIVTSATWLGQWRTFGQRLEDDSTIRAVPIKFQKIRPAMGRPRRAAPPGGNSSTQHGSLVITNEYALAREVCSYSPDFAELRPHDFDRTLME